MQQQVVRAHRNHALSQQKGPLHGENQEVAAQHMLSRIRRSQHVRAYFTVHTGEVPRAQQVASHQGHLFPFHLRHRHREH